MTNRNLASSPQLRDGVVKCFSLPTWVSLISGLFQTVSNPRENVSGKKTSAFKGMVIFLERSVLIYYAGCNAPGQQALTLAVCKSDEWSINFTPLKQTAGFTSTMTLPTEIISCLTYPALTLLRKSTLFKGTLRSFPPLVALCSTSLMNTILYLCQTHFC